MTSKRKEYIKFVIVITFMCIGVLTSIGVIVFKEYYSNLELCSITFGLGLLVTILTPILNYKNLL